MDSKSPIASMIQHGLDAALAERARVLTDSAPGAAAEFVLYWMRTAMRARENPALDTALAFGARLDLPVFVYQGLSERYPFASDRHHTFILEGAADVAADLAERGVAYAFHLERPGHRGGVLVELARCAAVVVTEDMPAAPLTGWTASLARAVEVPVVLVDTACLVPMRLVARAHDRAYAFRTATARLREERLSRPWRDLDPAHPPPRPELPFEPVSLGKADVASLVAACEIDHGVPPVPAARGGSRAGLERWRRFRDGKLARYARDRNDPLRAGVSRMSPYLHYGMVSPFLVAREAAAAPTEGARKYLDELLVWREAAYSFCFHQPRHAGPEALPEWARRTLAEHETDPRPALPSWEALARGRTGDALWDAAQVSLLRHGELHNNVRMTWGKALLGWTENAAGAMALLEDLNHRYALDGRDPASYGGILWCLGLFDRPFTPRRPILGTVRGRSTRQHARRLDVERYSRRVRRPVFGETPRVLVVGGGLAGLACARTLHDAGLEVKVLDKGRGPGGRTSTRRHDEMRFDHGAQYFTVRDRRLAPYLRSWLHDGVVAPWRGRIGTLCNGEVREKETTPGRYVGVPGMNALVRHLAADLDVEFGVRVESIERWHGEWRARTADGRDRGAFGAAVVAVPAPQAVPLLAPSEDLARAAAVTEMAPTVAVMAAFAEPVDLPLDGAFVSDSPLSWVARDSSKPDRPGAECWVLHAGTEFSVAHLETASEELAPRLLESFREAAGRDLPPTLHLAGHRWRYASTTRPAGAECLFDPELRLAACGDWCLGSRMELAWLSGAAAAGRLLGRLAERSPRDEEPRQRSLW